ncbi:phage head morphogenesis protein [Pasteurella multocida]|uniref:phage head morphogenesis protein n=2 Tax=Pasteurella multocida TaxID=747 RepID=UPI001D02254A|nr:phage minor head protein [Pasteurella multocida]
MMMNLPEVMKGQKKPRIVRFKPIKQSRQTELWYGRQLVSRVKWLREQIERALQNKQSPFFMDSDFDVFNTEQLLSVIKKLSEKDRTNEIESLASEFVSRGNVQNQREVGENLKRQTGLDLQAFLNQNTTVLNKMSVMTTANVQLIKSIEQQYLDKVQTIITQGAISGKLNRDLAKEIRDLGGVTENRAKFIARDQSSKINAALTQARHEELGIKKYRWSTSGDERVRDSHAENDGKVFSYDDPPETGHPGHEINCRCVQIPVLDETIKTSKNQTQSYNLEKVQMRSDWQDDFPDTVIDRKLGDATSHPLYQNAKKGNVADAYQLAKDLVSDEAVEKLRKIINGRDAILVPVHAEEAVGRNMIPVAVATVLSKKLNLPVDLSIVQATKVSRTGGDGWHRLIYSPAFDGNIPKGKLAIILDDTQTQGGTLASLKGYIEHQKGKVIASYALTGKQYSVQLRLSKETLQELRGKYGSIEQWWSKKFGYDFSKLTEWEARFILNSRKTPDEVRNTILAREQA